MAVKSCAVAWTQGGNAFTCGSARRRCWPRPRRQQRHPERPASLAAGKSDNLAISFTLPTAADNAFQGKSADLSLVFTATQRTAGVR